MDLSALLRAELSQLPCGSVFVYFLVSRCHVGSLSYMSGDLSCPFMVKKDCLGSSEDRGLMGEQEAAANQESLNTATPP